MKQWIYRHCHSTVSKGLSEEKVEQKSPNTNLSFLSGFFFRLISSQKSVLFVLTLVYKQHAYSKQ